MEKKSTGISKWGLVALVVSSSIGSGVFGIRSDLASSAAQGQRYFMDNRWDWYFSFGIIAESFRRKTSRSQMVVFSVTRKLHLVN